MGYLGKKKLPGYRKMINGNFKTNYEDEIKIFQTPFVKFWLVLLFIGLVIFPFVADRYIIYLINLCGIAIIGALGLNILTGYTGQISLGHAGFLAIGGYTSAILSTKFGIPFWLAMPLSGIMAALAGMIVAVPSLRLKGLYIAITTFAFGFIVDHVIIHWESLTNGPSGISAPRPSLGIFVFDSDKSYYFIIIGMVILATAFARNLFRGRVGRAFIAIRDRDIAAEIIGINLTKYKIQAFSISSFYAGIAGSLMAHYFDVITFENFTLMLSIQYLAMIIVGGVGSILGSIYGATFITLLPEVIRFLTDIFREEYPSLTTRFADLKSVTFGLIIILFLIFGPKGLYGMWRDIKVYWKNWPFTY